MTIYYVQFGIIASKINDRIRIQSIKNHFSFSSLNTDVKYRYQLFENMSKMADIRRKIKDRKEKQEKKRLIEEQKKKEKIYKELLRRGHISLLKDFQSSIFMK